jgi:spore coat polysaccharide biosynthesis protein SpsF (cytidylyltransferase family)
MNAAAIICTRQDSKRLPGKAFRKVAGIPAIEHILRRLEPIREFPIVLAVPVGCAAYDHLPGKFPSMDIRMCYGNPESPLHRMAEAIETLELPQRWIVRITHDDIIIDDISISELVYYCDATPGAGYGISQGIVEGAGVEVIRRENLLAAAAARTEPTEFVSYFVKKGPYQVSVALSPRPSIRRDYRLTMDYPEDWTVLDAILSATGPDASLDKICDFIDRNPHAMILNRLPKVTVYTCAYNAERWVSATMRSVLNSDFTSFEYIVIDDCSTDQTMFEIAKNSADPRVRVIRNEKNVGLAACSNIAVTQARGQYVMRVDADDLLDPHALTNMIGHIQNNGSHVVYAGYREIDENDAVTNWNCPPNVHHHAGCALMDKRMINEIRFTDGLRHWDSLDLYKRISSRIPIAYENRPLWSYRKHPRSMSASMTEERKMALEQVGGPHAR